MSRSLPRGTALLAAAALAACSGDDGGGPCRVDKAAAFDLSLRHGLLFVPVGIAGQSGLALLDTGAERSAVTQSLVDRLQLPADERHGTVMSGVGGLGNERHDALAGSFVFAGYDPGLSHYAVLDVPRPLASEMQLDALVGGDVLSRFDLDLDEAHKRLTVYRVMGCTGRFVPWTEPYASVPLNITWGHRPRLPVRIDGQTIMALLDTGATGSILDSAAAARIGVTAEALQGAPNARTAGAAGVDVTSTAHRFSSIEIGSDRFDQPEFGVMDRTLREADMLLGEDYLRVRHVWISYSTAQLFIAAPQP